MKNKLLLYLILITFCTCWGCTTYRDSVYQKSERSFIKFAGNWQNTSVFVDGHKAFDLEQIEVCGNGPTGSEDCVMTDPPLKYQLTPGKHNIKVYNGDKMIVNRILFFTSNSIMEVDVP